MKLQKITFGAAFANELLFRMPFHKPMPRRNWVGSHTEAPSGVVDAWRDGLYPELEFEQRWIPGSDVAGQSGWYGAGNVEEFLVAARDAEQFRIYLDKDGAPAVFQTCVAVPGSVEEGRESSKAQFFWFRLKARDVDGTLFQI